jgi:hypothetical protein
MNDLGSLILEILLFGPFTVPYQLLEPDPGPACGWSFAAAPYAQLADGYLAPARCIESVPYRSDAPLRRALGSREVAGQVSLEGLASIDGSYGRGQARARLLTAFRLEVDAAYADYFAPQG